MGLADMVSLVLPVKETARAKSRLGLPSADRRAVALELAATTLEAALASPSVGTVFVVTSDPLVAALAQDSGVVVVAEGPGEGTLNDAVTLGRSRARADRPGGPVAVLMADLPLLRPSELDLVMAQFHEAQVPLFVSDHLGTGTTMLIHGPNELIPIRFGGCSADFHAEAGYRPATGDLPGLRQDLDTWQDLTQPRLEAFRARVRRRRAVVSRLSPVPS